MRERLIELLRSNNAAPEKTCPRFGTGESCEGCKYLTDDIGCDYIAREADYLLANGVIVPPCKVGQTVYFVARNSGRPIGTIDEIEIVQIAQRKEGFHAKGRFKGSLNEFEIRSFKIDNYSFFTGEEEAEQALVNYESSKNEKGR